MWSNTYVGSIEKHTLAMWVYKNDNMVYQNVTLVLGLEILMNVPDNKQ
jgi:DNA topoisomerase-2